MDVSELPMGNAPKALPFPHFPTRWQAVVWRNWNLVPVEIIAKVLHASVPDIRSAADAMGLEYRPGQLDRWRERGFQTVIRRNWELLDYEQLLELLEWEPDRLAFTLKEDDFLFYKLGLCKPVCEKVYYRPLTPEETARTETIRKTVRSALAEAPLQAVPFDFLDRFGKHRPLPAERNDFDLRMIYSYSALYGDPLLDDELGSYPEGQLADYAACGVNAVWIQGTLYTLVPWLGEDQEISRDWQRRLRNLRKLVERAGKFGIRVIVYLNEPRAMPEKFFASRPDWRGAADESGDHFALCTSHAPVLEALGQGVERLFREVPGLGGIFTITMSENLTHCKSRGGSCPRCRDRTAGELAAEVNNVIAGAMFRAAPEARMIAYAWSWPADELESIIASLDSRIQVMAVSERGVRTDCLGCPGEIADYSISKPGPGDYASRVWRSALAHGSAAVAKVQFNCSWELAAVPYIPVPDLVEEHIANLKAAGIRDLMLAWTLGGYPGGNLELLNLDRRRLAEYKFGPAAPDVLRAWKCFSEAFHKYFPFNLCATIYFAPQNFGPMTLLYPEPTGRDASMIGFPFDDLETWRGAKGNAAAAPLEHPYPPEVMEEAFRLLSEEWEKGLRILAPLALAGKAAEELAELKTIAQAVYCHFRSSYLQIRWVRHRGDRSILREERDLALRLLRIVRRDSRIGYEASNHYFYTENDLLEKILNCGSL